jgi:hypothetical protein
MKRHCIAVALVLLPLAVPVDAGPPARNGKIKVFVLAGQSNMEGHGVIKGRPEQKGTLETLTKAPATAGDYKHLLDRDGNWITRDDVFLAYNKEKGRLTIGKSAARNAESYYLIGDGMGKAMVGLLGGK